MGLKTCRTMTHRTGSNAAFLMIGAISLLLTACTVKVVQPYDERLYNDTEAFFKKADVMVEQGKKVSPDTDAQRAAISKPEEHPGHVSAFSSKYDTLAVDSDALILRALANSQSVGSLGSETQARLNDVIDKSIPSACPDLLKGLEKVDLTTMNFVDLKCTVLTWKEQHGDPALTRGTGILKKANWEGRKKALFDTILAIQKAEGFKKNK